MRRVVAFAAAALVATKLVVACGDFGSSSGQAPSPADGSVSPSDGGVALEAALLDGPAGETGTSSMDGAAVLPYDGERVCSNFIVDADSWMPTGGVKRAPQGFVITLSSSEAHIIKSFVPPFPIRVSHVTLDWDLTPGASVGSEDTTNVRLLTQFYGGTELSSIQNSIDAKPSTMTFFFQNAVNATALATTLFFGSPGEAYAFLNGPGANVETTWASQGFIKTGRTGGMMPPAIAIPTLVADESRTKQFSLQIGGTAVGVTSFAVTIRSVCVSFE